MIPLNAPQNLMIWFGIFGALLAIPGGQWDSWLHVKQGHELLAIPHLVIMVGLTLFVIAGFFAFLTLLRARRELVPTQKRGLWLLMLGGGIIPLALMFDEGWHRFTGLDQTTWSAPHAIMFASVAAVLLGLALFTAHKNRVLPLLFFVTILLLGLLSLGDFDHPHMQEIVQKLRPGFTYPIAVTGIFTFAFLLIATVTKQAGHATIAALFAWVFFVATNALIGTVGGFTHTILPFPIVIPALIFDACFFLQKKSQRQPSLRLKDIFVTAFLSATACYAMVIAWSSLYTAIDTPQQLSGTKEEWAIWYFAAVPLVSFASAWIVNKFSQWAQMKSESKPNEIAPTS